MAQTKNLCAQIPIALHTQVCETREQSDLTTAEYITNLLIRETKGCVLFRVAHLLIQNAKQPGGYSDGSGYPPGCLFDVVLDCLTGPVICPAGFWAWEIAPGQSAAAQADWSLSHPAAASIADSF